MVKDRVINERFTYLLVICYLICDGHALQILSGRYGYFTSPLHPQPYANNLDMEWRIEARKGYRIKLRFTAFDLEDSYEEGQGACVYDYVLIAEENNLLNKFCGNPDKASYNAPPTNKWIRSKDNTLTVKFFADYSNENITPRGFVAHYVEEDIDECADLIQKEKYLLVDWDELLVCNHFCNNVPGSYYCSCRSGFQLHSNNHSCVARFCENVIIRDEQGVIESPDYPQPYAKMSHCSWDILVREGWSVLFTFNKSFEIEEYMDNDCGYDVLSIDSGTVQFYCGNDAPNNGEVIDTNSRHVAVKFDSDLSVEMKGFQIHYNTRRMRCLKELHNPVHGHKSSHLKAYYEFGDVVFYECNTGYDLIGSSRLECLSDGKWDEPEPICRIKSCGIPQELLGVKHSKIVEYETKQFTYLEIITVRCYKWYRLEASTHEWRCENNKEWVRHDNVTDKIMPVCRPVCGIKKPEQRTDLPALLRANIVSADEVDENEWPWMVFLNFGNKTELKATEYTCAGTLISPNYILTAGHCMKSEAYASGTRWANQTHVWLGVHNRDAPETTVTYALASKIIVHPKYGQETKLNFDVALIRLDKAVRMTDKHRPICLPTSSEDRDMVTPDEEGDVIGWNLYDDIRYSDKILLKAKFPIVGDQVCLDTFKRIALENHRSFNREITDNMFCAGYDDADDDDAYVTCRGASGGPFQMEHTGTHFQNGVVSHGSGEVCGTVVSYTVFAKLNNDIVDWIMTETNNLREIGLEE